MPVSPPGGSEQPVKGTGELAPGPVHSRVKEVRWNEKPVGLMGLGEIVQPVMSAAIWVGLIGCPTSVRP